MSIPSKRMIGTEIKRLRTIINNVENDEVLTRIAYAVELALRWSIEDTQGWKKPSADVLDEARNLKDALIK